MKLLLIKPKEKFEVVKLPKKHHYTDLKKLLEIDSPLTVVERKIGEKYFDIWLDDEGLLKEDRQLTGACMNAGEYLVGNLLIATHDDEGNTTGLTDEQINLITKHLIEKKDFLDFKKIPGYKLEYGDFSPILIERDNGYFLTYEV